MNIQLIRNATLKLSYAGHTILLDPFFADKELFPTFANRGKNPRVDLPVAPEAIVEGVEMVLVSHLHNDHFDAAAQAQLDKALPLFCQPGDEQRIQEKGFTNAQPIGESIQWETITIHRVNGRHGSTEPVLNMMGQVSGFVLQAAGEPTIYWCGDTVWYDDVEATLAKWQPDIVITHSGGAVWAENELIIMDGAQTVRVCQAVPQAKVMAVHLEALDHCLLTRQALRDYATAHGIDPQQLLIPDDGATVNF